MSVSNNWSISGLNPSTVGSVTVASGTSALYFPAPSGNIVLAQGAVTTPNAFDGRGQLTVSGNSVLNGQPFVISASGDFQVGPGGACPNVTIELVANTGFFAAPLGQKIIPVWTVIATTGAIKAQNNTGVSYPWRIKAEVCGTTNSGILSGYQINHADNTLVGPSALTAVLSGLNFASSTAVFGLAVRATFSVSEANIANMYQFGLASF